MTRLTHVPGAASVRADTVVVGSGFGACLAAEPLVAAGERVVMLERGGWVQRGPRAWAPEATLELSPYAWQPARPVLSTACVGGPSVFYGAVSLRLRTQDLPADAAVVGTSGAAWPFGHAALEPHYAHAERMLDVAGELGADPTEPPHSAAYAQPPAPLAPVPWRIDQAAREVGLTPSRLPLAINHRLAPGRSACVGCGTCDTFACAIGAKNDLTTTLLPGMLDAGLDLRPHTLVTRLEVQGGRVTAVHALDLRTWRRIVFRAERVILAAGALGSAHLALASGLDRRSPAPAAVGAYLTRHCSAIVYGVFPRRLEPAPGFHKQLAFHDLVDGDPSAPVEGPLGTLQQIGTPPAALVEHHLPRALGRPAGRLVGHLTGLLAMAQDQPRSDNRVRADAAHRDAHGMPALAVEHEHTPRDVQAREHLVQLARRVLAQAGAATTYVHPIMTFSHAAGTLRMGLDPRTSVLDADGRFRGLDNLYVTDAAALPTSGSVNPSLTVAANAARIGRALSGAARTREVADVAA